MKSQMNLRYWMLIFIVFNLLSCNGIKKEDDDKKIYIVTTLFPLYDFAKNIGKDKVKVELLLPPGVEAHSYEPKPEDILKIHKADIFIYTGKYMEPWAEKIIKSVDNKKLIVIDASMGINEVIEHESHEDRGHRHDGKIDPHIWLDFDNAKIMVDNILAGIVSADELNKKFYEENASFLKETLRKIDQDYRNGLSSCKTRYFFHAGHFAFGYLAKRYNLEYISAYPGLSPEEEPTPRRVGEMVQKIKKYKVKYIFYEELTIPRIANVLSKETGVTLLRINSAHNLSKEDLGKGTTYINIMENNLRQLRIGLECR